MSVDSQLAPASAQPRPGLLRGRVLATLSALHEGCLTLVEDGHEQRLGQADGDDPLHVRVTIRRPAAWRALALGGSIGAAESYADGDWDCDDLVALVRLLVRNRDLLDRMDASRRDRELLELARALDREAVPPERFLDARDVVAYLADRAEAHLRKHEHQRVLAERDVPTVPLRRHSGSLYLGVYARHNASGYSLVPTAS